MLLSKSSLSCKKIGFQPIFNGSKNGYINTNVVRKYGTEFVRNERILEDQNAEKHDRELLQKLQQMESRTRAAEKRIKELEAERNSNPYVANQELHEFLSEIKVQNSTSVTNSIKTRIRGLEDEIHELKYLYYMEKERPQED